MAGPGVCQLQERGQCACAPQPVYRNQLLPVLPATQVYKREAQPVEDFFRDAGLLLDFEITAGIPETMPVLMPLLQSYAAGKRPGQQQQQA